MTVERMVETERGSDSLRSVAFRLLLRAGPLQKGAGSGFFGSYR